MIAKDRGRGMWLFGFALAVVVIGNDLQARAQQDTTQKYQVPPPAPNAKANPQYNVNVKDINVPGLDAEPTAIPVNPGDPIAMVNGQIITRQQLADECVAREGKKVLELLINRTLIDQALRGKKLEVTAAEIDQEIETVAQRFGISREGWLRTLDKERGISPVQYARDIIYPALALRKLCSGRVQVTPDRHEGGLRGAVRREAAVPDDPGRQADHGHGDLGAAAPKPRRLREDRQGTIDGHGKPVAGRAAGRADHAARLSPDPVRRGIPATRRRRPADKDPSHKPKDGDFTGPIQVGETVWVILRRESVVPAATGVNLKDEHVRKQTYEMIYEVKLKEAMAGCLPGADQGFRDREPVDRHRQAGQRGERPDYGVDGDVKLMSRETERQGCQRRCDAPAASGCRSREPSCRPPPRCRPRPPSSSRSSIAR